ncbi:double-strand break repair helicase AddA [Cognatishimia sp. D5M38]|uniref:DNA 3'-5' helicase n=1 Tax=Cognatishimia coralii TaxID=3083254 RepID=A0ABU8QEU8_9RHOB
MNDATRRQVQAAQPRASTWLNANAGSGKTRVLTDRVARLLLQGVEPQHILCLTYTKAAASEMQNRLFKRLGAWAMKDDRELRHELEELGVDGPVDRARLRDARTLFARAIETPGGLKIQTIHSFCASLLRRFPLEAGVSPLFREMEDRAATLLRETIVEEMAAGDDADLVAQFAQVFTGTDFQQISEDVAKHSAAFAQDPSWEAICEALGIDPQMSENVIASEVFLGDEAALFGALIAAMKTGSATDVKNTEKLALVTDFGIGDLPNLERIFLTGATAKSPFSAKIGSIPTKKLQSEYPGLTEKLNKLMARVEEARPKRLALANARRSMALWRFGHAFVERYENQKQQLGWLDFDDLILRARDLLNDPAVAAWVLYRLDGGIDHILVDEAQDTSPEQWQVIERLAQEFTSGEGAHDAEHPRTIFVVGDKKQSIYSFQGADPAEFDRMREEFAARLDGSQTPLQKSELEHSFRSSYAILRVVDECFKLRADTDFEQHIAFNSDMPGRVDLWPVIEPTAKAEEGDWFDPVDRLSEMHHTVHLARMIADQIKRMIATGATIPAGKDETGVYRQRRVRAGDFLILVQRRSDLFQEIIRACKAADLPIAGADRLKVGAELAVRDLAALLSFLSTPEDSLSLATVLRSPLFGWSEQALFDLAHRREVPLLWQALRDRGNEFPETMEILGDLMGQTDFLRPYDLIERILTRHKGRAKLLSRLGSEAEDGINALLSQALAYERSSVPSLTGFLVWMETDDLEIKRQMDSAEDRIRVMTVHGSKGLEAPIVILPDTGKRNRPSAPAILDADGVPLWTGPSAEMPEAVSERRVALADRQMEERQRLLYVAMTRAEKWLIVAAAGDLDKSGETWYQTIEAGMKSAGAVPQDFLIGQGLRYSHGEWGGPIEDAPLAKIANSGELETVFTQDAPIVTASSKTLSPSELGGAKALAGEAGLDEETAKTRGSAIHALLENLPNHPPEDWERAARHILDLTDADPEDTTLLTEAARVLKSEHLAHVFAEDALVEVSISAHLGSDRLHGTIDRLIITPDRILAIDFKTNAVVPQSVDSVPEGLLRQMGAYAHALAQVYPDRRIETALLWTKSTELMLLPQELVNDALHRALAA